MVKRKGFLLSLISVLLFITFLFSVVFRTIPIIEKKYFYPLKYGETIKKYCIEYELDFYLIVSLINTESSFRASAVSEKGAKGLMQITDSTAKYIAKNLKKKQYDIFSVNNNVEFGCYYMRYLLDRFSVEETALCAYNAGEGNVSIWLMDEKYSIDGERLREIPFAETRTYIKKIYKSYAKYEKLYGDFLDKRKKFE